MKKLNFIVALIALVGQVSGFIGIFVADSNDQLMASLWTFLLFGMLGGMALILDVQAEKNQKKVW